MEPEGSVLTRTSAVFARVFRLQTIAGSSRLSVSDTFLYSLQVGSASPGHQGRNTNQDNLGIFLGEMPLVQKLNIS